MQLSLTLLLFGASLPSTTSHGRVSRHLVVDDGMVAMIADAPLTAGPFAGQESEFIDSSNMLEAATSGSPGLTADRDSVLDGVPLSLNITVVRVTDGQPTSLFEGVEVFLWQTDAAGTYAAFESEGTLGHRWLRNKQTTGTDGVVHFDSILPGW